MDMDEEIAKTIVKMKACGCRKDIIDTYETFKDKENKTRAMKLFKKYRSELQGELDEECKSIDCIDYLIYDLERSK